MNLWTDESWQEYNGDRHWAKLRVKRDPGTGENYFDILVGKKDHEWHAHLGIGLDQTVKFLEDREQLHDIRRTLESEQKGLIDVQDLMMNAKALGGAKLILKFDLNPNSGQVTVRDFGLVE
jgi:hypothetical protein